MSGKTQKVLGYMMALLGLSDFVTPFDMQNLMILPGFVVPLRFKYPVNLGKWNKMVSLPDQKVAKVTVSVSGVVIWQLQ